MVDALVCDIISRMSLLKRILKKLIGESLKLKPVTGEVS